MSDSTQPESEALFEREFLIHVGQWVAAFVVAAMLTVIAIGLGWLPLCTKAAGMATLAGSAVLVGLVELIRRQSRQG